MADLIKKIKIKKQDGTFTDYIPIGADAVNIETSDGESVELKLNKKPYYYNTVADMKADTKLKAGDVCQTLSYHEENDGITELYKIIDSDFSESVDNYNYVELQKDKLYAIRVEQKRDKDIKKALLDINTISNRTVVNPEVTQLYDLYYDGYANQGCCSNGNYMYIAFVKSETANTKLVKLNLSNGSVDLVVENYCYEHANDMCCAGQYLYISHADSPDAAKYKISKVNIETLEQIEDYTIEYPLVCLSYNNTYNLFIAQESSTKRFIVMNENFKKVYSFTPKLMPYYKTGPQSIDGTGDLIYAVNSSINNQIYVTDWHGRNYIIFALESLNEPQGIGIVRNTNNNNDFYICDKINENSIWHCKVYKFTSDVEKSARKAGPNEVDYNDDGTTIELYRNDSLTAAKTNDTIQLNSNFLINKFKELHIVVNFGGGSRTIVWSSYNNLGGNIVLATGETSASSTLASDFYKVTITRENSNILKINSIYYMVITYNSDGSINNISKTNNNGIVIHRILGIV